MRIKNIVCDLDKAAEEAEEQAKSVNPKELESAIKKGAENYNKIILGKYEHTKSYSLLSVLQSDLIVSCCTGQRSER